MRGSKQRLFFSLLATSLVVLGSVANVCAKEVVVLLDLTSSITSEEWRSYDKAFQSMVNGLTSGDRATLVTITDAKLGEFHAAFVAELKNTNSAVRDKIDNRPRIQGLIQAYVNSKKQAGKANSTQLFSSLRGAGQLFAQSNQQDKWLVLLSDMMDSSIIGPVTGRKCEMDGLLTNLKKESGGVATLNGVKVFVNGAGGPGMSDSAYDCMQKFWEKYFQAAGVTGLKYARQLQDIR